MWRSLGIPTGTLAGDVDAVLARVVADDIAPQVAYHRANAVSVHCLDHRLHRAGTVLFAVSCLSCVTFIATFLIDHAWTVAHATEFVALSAGLPAVGTAFSASASRAILPVPRRGRRSPPITSRRSASR